MVELELGLAPALSFLMGVSTTVPALYPVAVTPLPGQLAWIIVKRSDPAVRALRDRHYSTERPGGRTVGPPGRVLVLVTLDGSAGWVTHYPDPALSLDRMDSFRCSLFRNEGSARSSDLIRAAVELTERVWAEHRPADGWLTYVEPGKIATDADVAGYCFRRAGWHRDRAWSHRRLIRLRRGLTTR